MRVKDPLADVRPQVLLGKRDLIIETTERRVRTPEGYATLTDRRFNGITESGWSKIDAHKEKFPGKYEKWSRRNIDFE